MGALLLGCRGDSAPSASRGRERVNAVVANAGDAPTPAELCDVLHESAEAPPFVWPALQAPPAAAPGWQWLNVWATWCAPCVEELPRLLTWQRRLAADGTTVTLQFVNVDDDAAALEQFRSAHPATPPSLRLADAAALTPWLESLGVGASSLPVHVLIDPKGRMRCVRAAAVEEADLPAVQALLNH